MRNNEDLRILKFEELKIRTEHNKYYLKLALETNAFFYLITGGVLGFYLGQPVNNHLEFFLLLPMLLGAVLGGIFIHGAELQKDAVNSIKKIKGDLKDRELNIEPIPDTHLLRLLLLIFGYIFFIVGASLILVPLIRASFVMSWEFWAFVGAAAAVLILGGLARRIFARIFDIKPDFDFDEAPNEAPTIAGDSKQVAITPEKK